MKKWESFRIQVPYWGHFFKKIILFQKFDIFNLKSNSMIQNQQKIGNLEYNRGGLVSISKLIVTFVSLNNFIFCYFGLCWINGLNFVTSTQPNYSYSVSTKVNRYLFVNFDLFIFSYLYLSYIPNYLS